MSGTSKRAFHVGLPADPPVVNGLTFAIDTAIADWITAQGITAIIIYSAAILVGATALWENGPFFTEIELLGWQAQVLAAKTAKTAWDAAVATVASDLTAAETAQQALDADPLNGTKQTTLDTALATLATDQAAQATAERTLADALATLSSKDAAGRSNPFYTAADWPAIALS